MVEGLGSGTSDPQEVGRKLGVQVVVEGTLRRHADKVRVAARVLSVRDGFQLWAKRFDRPASDLLIVSDEVAQSIADALTVGLHAPARQALSNPRATELYLRGRAELCRQWELPVRKAAELLEQAHRLAPSDVTILSSYARARARRWFFEGGAKEGRTARELAEQAIARAPERGESWLALAQVRFVECDLVSTARLLKTTLLKSPLLAEAHELLGELLLEVGSISDALDRLENALSLDPSLRTRNSIARGLALQGRWHEASARLLVPPEDEQAQFGTLAVRARLALWRGQREVFVPELPPDLPDMLTARYAAVAMRALASGKLSDTDLEFGEAHLAKVEDAARFAVLKRELAAELFCAAGDPKRAQVAIHEAVDIGLVDENWMRHCPALAPLRDQAPFERALGVVSERAERVRQALAEA
jgi:serine/threonine-protein kinase